jgi:hypothetical protein
LVAKVPAKFNDKPLPKKTPQLDKGKGRKISSDPEDMPVKVVPVKYGPHKPVGAKVPAKAGPLLPITISWRKREPRDTPESTLTDVSNDDKPLPSIRVKRRSPNLDKGKGRKMGSEPEETQEKHDSDDEEKTRIRKSILSTGELRDPFCKRCVRLRINCRAQVGGRACVDCAQVKMKCEDFGAYVGDETDVEKKGKASQAKVKTLPEPLSPASPGRSKPAKKTTVKQTGQKNTGKQQKKDPRRPTVKDLKKGQGKFRLLL